MDSEQLIEKWMKHSTLQKTSQKQYKIQVRLFFKQYKKLSISNVNEFLRRGQGDNRSYTRKYAITNLLKFMRSTQLLTQDDYFKYAEDIKLIPYKIKKRKASRTLKLADLEHLIKNTKDPKLKLILMIGFDTAARIRAILKLRHTDIREYQGKKALFMREKGQKTALKIITDATYRHLKKYTKANNKFKYILIDSNVISMEILDDAYYENWLVLRRTSKNILGEEISFHWVRRGAGVYWYEKTNHNIVFVQELLGHDSPSTTSVYLQLGGEQVREKMKKEDRSW